MAQRKCRYCLYWHSRLPAAIDPKDDSIGECRLNPPIYSQPADARRLGEKKGAWPETYGSDWCGQFTLDRWPQSTGGGPTRLPSLN